MTANNEDNFGGFELIDAKNRVYVTQVRNRINEIFNKLIYHACNPVFRISSVSYIS